VCCLIFTTIYCPARSNEADTLLKILKELEKERKLLKNYAFNDSKNKKNKKQSALQAHDDDDDKLY